MFGFLRRKKKWEVTDWQLYDMLEMTLESLPGNFGVVRYPGIPGCVFVFDDDKPYAEDVKITFLEMRKVRISPRKFIGLIQEKLK